MTIRLFAWTALLVGSGAFVLEAQTPACGRPGESWEAGYQARLARLMAARSWPIGPGTSDSDAGKRDWPALLAEMWKARGDPTKLHALIRNEGATLLASKWAGSFYRPFSAPGYTLYYSCYHDLLPKEQVEQIHRMIASDGWGFMSRPDHHMDAIYQHTEFNSENFNWMARMAGVYWAHELQDEARIAYFDRYLDNLARALFAAGRVEWNSNNYWGYAFQAPLVLFETTAEPKVKAQSEAILDWMAMEAALHYIDGFQAGADVRAKEGAYKPFAGSVWPYSYLYFSDETHHASFSDAEAAAHFGVQEAGYVPYSSYRPPAVAIAIAQRKFQTPVEVLSAKPFYALDQENYGDWNGKAGRNRRFEFETIYLERDYTLASLATERPNGDAQVNGQRPFSEQSLWRLAVTGSNQGPLQVFGNSGTNETMAGRSPFEEIAQYGNVMVRAIRGTDRMWVAIPKSARVEWRGPAAFADLGHGVYAAFRPFGARRQSQRDWTDRSYTQLVWEYLPAALGGLALEVGMEREHGSFERFQDRVMASRGLDSDGPERLRYVAGDGRVLQVQFMPVGSYKMSDGTIIQPAGKLPRVWRDGRPEDFGAWDSYSVRTGENIIAQQWGGHSLKASAAGVTLQIRVDPATAQATCSEVSKLK